MSEHGWHNEKTRTPTKPGHMVWCPFCDWKAPDSLIGRKRMGLHCANKHPGEVLFKQGETPKDLE